MTSEHLEPAWLFDGPPGLVNAEVVERWTSRTARLWQLRPPDGRDWIVKVGEGWGPPDVAAITSAFARWQQCVEDTRLEETVATIETVGVLNEPPRLYAEYVDGEELSQILSSGGGGEQQLAACGRLLGAFHRENTYSGEHQDYQRDFFKIAKRLVIPRRIASSLALHLSPVLSAGDFAPYNIRVQPDGRIVVLDAPQRPQTVSVHCDIARFAYWLHRTLVAHRATQNRSLDVFLQGYSEVTGRDFDFGENKRLLAVYVGHLAQKAVAAHSRRRNLRGIPWEVERMIRARSAATGR